MIERLKTAIEQNKINRILVVDDVFDPPPLDNDLAAEIIDYIGKSSVLGELKSKGITEEMISEVKVEIYGSSYDSELVLKIIKLVYEMMLISAISEPDLLSVDSPQMLNGKLGAVKAILPLMKLLDLMKGLVDVRYVGKNDEPIKQFSIFEPQLVLLDYYLSAEVDPSDGEGSTKDVSNSRQVLENIFKTSTSGTRELARPSVLLMSSKDLTNNSGDAPKIDSFRAQVNRALKENDKMPQGRVNSWRFGFLPKQGITLDGNQVKIEPRTIDVLLDICQAHDFGSHLDNGLQVWKGHVSKAVEDLFAQVEELDLKDFAYLLRFRLKPENERLSEYFRWLLTESLDSAIENSVGGAAVFGPLDDLQSNHPSEQVSGAYDGATVRIARMFHNARFSKRHDASNQYRLGDVYMLRGTTELRAVLTADCDLALRSDGSCNQPIPLTVRGRLLKLDKPTSDVSDLVVLESGEIRNIEWQFGKIEFKELKPPVEGSDYKYIGTLKSQYAQDLQKKALNHIGRVGLEVAPTIGFNAPATVQFMMHGPSAGGVPLDLKLVGEACTVIMPRGGIDKLAKVIFYRSFYYQLIEALKGVEESRLDTLPQLVRKLWEKATSEGGNEELHRVLCVEGLEFTDPDKKQTSRYGVTVQKKYAHTESAFCTIIIDVSKADV